MHLNVGFTKFYLAPCFGSRFRGIPILSEYLARVCHCQSNASYSDQSTLQDHKRNLLVGEFTIETSLKFRYTVAGPNVDAESC